jgi:hypothetical protein
MTLIKLIDADKPKIFCKQEAAEETEEGEEVRNREIHGY